MARKTFKLLSRFGENIILSKREPVRPENAIVVNVPKMVETEAISPLLGVPPSDLDDQESTLLNDVREVVTRLDCMPLAVDLARAYVENMRIIFSAISDNVQ